MVVTQGSLVRAGGASGLVLSGRAAPVVGITRMAATAAAPTAPAAADGHHQRGESEPIE